jgi:hypothetical protein
MVRERLVSFGDGAGHLMERLLEHAGVSEVREMTVKVEPEADDELYQVLREAAAGGWVVQLRGRGEAPDVQLSWSGGSGLRGHLFVDDRSTTESVAWPWSRLVELHIY